MQRTPEQQAQAVKEHEDRKRFSELLRRLESCQVGTLTVAQLRILNGYLDERDEMHTWNYRDEQTRREERWMLEDLAEKLGV